MSEVAERELLVFGDKTFKIKLQPGDKVTFGPFSPPTRGGFSGGSAVGTLRIYRGTKDNIVACFAGVHGFRDLSMDYAEEVVVEMGDSVWHHDEQGYIRANRSGSQKRWMVPDVPAIEPPKPARRRRKATPKKKS